MFIRGPLWAWHCLTPEGSGEKAKHKKENKEKTEIKTEQPPSPRPRANFSSGHACVLMLGNQMTKQTKNTMIPENSGRGMRQDDRAREWHQAISDSGGGELFCGRWAETRATRPGTGRQGRRLQVTQQGPPHLTLTVSLHRIYQGNPLPHTQISSSSLHLSPSSRHLSRAWEFPWLRRPDTGPRWLAAETSLSQTWRTKSHSKVSAAWSSWAP